MEIENTLRRLLYENEMALVALKDDLHLQSDEEGQIGYHQRKVGLGVWTARRRQSVDLVKFYNWKDDPTLCAVFMEQMANELVQLIRSWSCLAANWVVTTPPQGASVVKTRDGMYPAGFLAKRVAVKLGLDFVSTLGRTDVKFYHHPKEALRQASFEVVVRPLDVALIVDDMITSGMTMKLSRMALENVGSPAFGFAWVG